MLRTVALGALCVILAACAGNAAGGGEPLLSTVQARTNGDRVQFALQVTNTSEGPVTLEYATGQSFDFLVLREGREVWRWSADRMFTQALRQETLAPGQTVSHEAEWVPGDGASGEYVVVGRLTSSSHPAEQRATFRLP